MSQILIVDDNPKNIQLLGNILTQNDYDLEYALSGKEALEYIEEETFDLILMDVEMPEIDGFEACKRIQKMENKKDIPLIFITARTDADSIQKGFDIGAVDYITKPLNYGEVLARVKTHIALKVSKDLLKRQNEILEHKVEERTKELELTQEATIASLASIVETRSKETGAHISRTKAYVSILARKLAEKEAYKKQLTPKKIIELCKSSALHDIGKVGISDHILMKAGKLTSDEFESMKKHAELGYHALHKAEESLGNNSFLSLAKEIAYNHHERWDGSGYPRGLEGEAIPLAARIMSIADVYDALVCKRVYKEPYNHDLAKKLIIEGKGTQFDPELVDAFIEVEKEFYEIAYIFADSEEERNLLVAKNEKQN